MGLTGRRAHRLGGQLPAQLGRRAGHFPLVEDVNEDGIDIWIPAPLPVDAARARGPDGLHPAHPGVPAHAGGAGQPHRGRARRPPHPGPAGGPRAGRRLRPAAHRPVRRLPGAGLDRALRHDADRPATGDPGDRPKRGGHARAHRGRHDRRRRRGHPARHAGGPHARYLGRRPGPDLRHLHLRRTRLLPGPAGPAALRPHPQLAPHLERGQRDRPGRAPAPHQHPAHRRHNRRPVGRHPRSAGPPGPARHHPGPGYLRAW